jgi:hypothetical protein
MAYTLVGASVRTRDLAARWEDADLTSLTIGQIYTTYQGVYLLLTHFAYPGITLYLNFIEIRDDFTALQLNWTLAQWLTDHGDATLPTTTSFPTPRERYVKYNDAFLAGYDVELINVGHSPDSELPPGDRFDLMIRKPSVNMSQMWRYFLCSVNGYLHRSILGANNALYILEGGRTRNVSGNNHLGLMSFREVGRTTQVPITDTMLHPLQAGQPLSEGALLTLPEEYSLATKTVLLVVGGYLHVLDGLYSVIGERTLKLHLANLNLADRYFESRDHLNLEPLGVERSLASPNKTSVNSLYSDAVIRKYLTLPQSFLIFVDTVNVYKRLHRLDNTKLPGVYQQETPFFRLPMFGTHGKVQDYIAYQEYQKYVYNTNYLNEPHYNYRTTEWRLENGIDETMYSSRPFHIADSFLMEFGTFV